MRAPTLPSSSGPRVARLLHRTVALVGLVVWGSLGVQVMVLMGSRGVLPVQPWLEQLAESGRVGFWELPTWLWFGAGDGALAAGVLVGGVLCLLSLAGLWPRVLMPISGLLYLGYVLGGRSWFSFQWDQLFVELCALLALLPRDRAAPWAHLLLRLMLFKLYFESGLAKWQSQLGDWQDGSAMLNYYQTAPLPTWLAWYAHQLPEWWHRLESWWTLFFELVLPFAVFGPRRLRLVALVSLTSFQLVNIATANYGFFAYLALCLHLLLLDERDLGGEPSAAPTGGWSRWLGRGLGALWVLASLSLGLHRFADLTLLPQLHEPAQRWRVANAYHLFAQVTTRRVEPEFQVRAKGEWQALELWHKPGDPARRPGFVAPHQPRVDFRLWFYGLSYARGAPDYVQGLLLRLCADPEAVQPLFQQPLPQNPEAVRVVFWDTRFSESRAHGQWWEREQVDSTRAYTCR